MDKKTCCALIGHNPMRFRFGWDEEADACIRLKLVLLQTIQELRNNDVTQFMTACDPGVGLWCGEIVNILRVDDNELQLYCVLPHEEQSTKWAPYLRERYFEMLEKCTYVTTASIHKTRNPQMDAYTYIIDQSDIILAVYDPTSIRGDDVDKAMECAEIKKRPAIFIHPDTFDVRLISERRL